MMGGGEHSFFDLLSHLPRKWNLVAVVPEEGELAKRLRKKGITTEVFFLPPIRPWTILKVLGTIRSYIHLCRRNAAHLVYANGSRAAFYGGIAGRLLGLPVIWHCRMMGSDPYLDSLIWRLSTRIVVNSNATAARFRVRVQPKVRIVYNGVDLDWLQKSDVMKPEAIGDDWKIVLVVARLSRWKRHDLALEAFEHAAGLDLKLHMVCLGGADRSDPKWQAELVRRTERSKVSDRIHWLGQVDDVRPWYKAAHILLLASDNEPFGRVVVEAMASSLPVIAVSSGGVPEIVQHGVEGLLVAPGDSVGLGRGIAQLSVDEQLRRRLGDAGKRRAASFSLSSHVAEMSSVFDGVTGRRCAGAPNEGL
jgi:glycosyltransferase involved in cell wall biosynthesis